MKYQRFRCRPATLEATVARYNSFVDSGVDADFGKPTPAHKIMEPPFHAAWATPLRTTRAQDCASTPNARSSIAQVRSSAGCIAAASPPAASASTASPARWCRVLSPVAMRWMNRTADQVLRSRKPRQSVVRW